MLVYQRVYHNYMEYGEIWGDHAHLSINGLVQQKMIGNYGFKPNM
jgi:hypothetical protein